MTLVKLWVCTLLYINRIISLVFVSTVDEFWYSYIKEALIAVDTYIYTVPFHVIKSNDVKGSVTCLVWSPIRERSFLFCELECMSVNGWVDNNKYKCILLLCFLCLLEFWSDDTRIHTHSIMINSSKHTYVQKERCQVWKGSKYQHPSPPQDS